MLNTEMLAKLRAFADETTAEFYIDTTDLYGALSDAQLELCKDVANHWDKNKREQMIELPLVIRDLVATVSSTIATGSISFALADIILLISMKWNPLGAVATGKMCTYVGSGTVDKLLENRFLTGGYYFWANKGLVYVNPEVDGDSGGYSLDYIATPTDISSSVQPVVQDVGHDAIVERAAWILLKDRETEQAGLHLQMYGKLLQGLV